MQRHIENPVKQLRYSYLLSTVSYFCKKPYFHLGSECVSAMYHFYAINVFIKMLDKVSIHTRNSSSFLQQGLFQYQELSAEEELTESTATFSFSSITDKRKSWRLIIFPFLLNMHLLKIFPFKFLCFDASSCRKQLKRFHLSAHLFIHYDASSY